ncbi:TPA: phage baseplate assembly protein [Citrobacter amalonaticus]
MSLTSSLDAIAGEFDLTVTTRWSVAAPRTIKEGLPCQVTLGRDVVLTGYIDEFIPSYDADSVSLKVTGRDKTGDLVDSSVVHKSGQWKGVTLVQLATELCAPFGIGVVNETDPGEPFASVVLEQGETVFELLDRLAKQRGVLLTSDGAGHLVITRASKKRAGTRLVMGKNILAARGRFSWKERNSEYIVKGTASGGGKMWDEQPPSQTGGIRTVTDDPEITRYRPKILVKEDSLTVSGANTRGEWYRSRSLGESRMTEITVAGWRERGDEGPVWAKNQLVDIEDEVQNLNVTWLIKSVTLTEGDGGRITVLVMVPPESMDMPAEVAKKKGKGRGKQQKGLTWD